MAVDRDARFPITPGGRVQLVWVRHRNCGMVDDPPTWLEVPDSGAWAGTFWDRCGAPDPEALLLKSREEAGRWVREPPLGANLAISVEEQPWFVAATYLHGGDEEYAVAHRLKLVS
jgi:hypothetical protein